jgi:hypothetical protein
MGFPRMLTDQRIQPPKQQHDNQAAKNKVVQQEKRR